MRNPNFPQRHETNSGTLKLVYAEIIVKGSADMNPATQQCKREHRHLGQQLIHI